MTAAAHEVVIGGAVPVGRDLHDKALSAARAVDRALQVVRGTMPLPGAPVRTRAAADELAITALNKLVAASTNTAKHNAMVAEIHNGLSAIGHKDYEPALSKLGALLGAETLKPKGDGRPDSVWCWANELWMTLEAKSEQKPTNEVAMDEVRQTNQHLKLLADDRGVSIPTGSVSFIVSPREVFKREAVVIAEPFVYKLHPDDMLSLLSAVDRLWLVLLTLRNISDSEVRREAVANALSDARLLPTDVLDRLTTTPLKPS